jgi:hypothetical protein
MDRNSHERFLLPRLLLMACLLALALLSAKFLRWRDVARWWNPQPQRAVSRTPKVLCDFVRISVPHEPLRSQREVATIADEPARIERDLEADAYEARDAGAGNSAARDLVAGLSATVTDRDAASEDGQLAPLGPPVASEVIVGDPDPDASDEVLPPPMPAHDVLPEALRLPRAELETGHRLRLASQASSSLHAISVWPRPTALVQALRSIDWHPRSKTWASDVLAQLDTLAQVDAIESSESKQVLNNLAKLAAQVPTFVRTIDAPDLQAHVLATAEALHRRVIVWQLVQKIAADGEDLQAIAYIDSSRIRAQARAAIASIPGEKAPRAWREFLLLDELDRLLAIATLEPHDRALIARAVLERMNSSQFTARQRELLNRPAMHQLAGMLRATATEPANVLEVIYAIEQFEETRTMPDAGRLAFAAASLRWSTGEKSAELVRRIDDNYRAANVRIAVTGDLLNRLLPKPQTKTEDVGEQILSAWVAGERDLRTKLLVRLIPDDDQWRLGLEATGTADTNTASYAGDATLFTQGSGTFTARKLFVVDRNDLHAWPAEAEATYSGQLMGASTRWDALPIISRLARDRAAEAYAENEWAAQQEVEAKLRERAAAILDKESQEPLLEARGKLRKNLLIPLSNMAVEPTPLRLYTSEERIVGYYRVAGVHQLGGHTPRPWAPSDSLLSMQLHETAINNVLAGLRLEGRADHLHTLFRDVWAQFGVADVEIPANMPDDVVIRFADEEAARVRLADGKMTVTLRLAEMRSEKRIWRDIVVENDYAPDLNSRRAVLVRAGSVSLEAERLRVSDQFALRGIFTKIFSDNDQIPLVARELADNPGVASLGVTQFIIRDGWVGLAWGPRRAATAAATGEESFSREAHARPDAAPRR